MEFYENLSYLLREWGWGKAWENMGKPRLFPGGNSERVYWGKKHPGVFERVNITESKWFSPGVYDFLRITSNYEHLVWLAPKNNDQVIISKWDSRSWKRVFVDIADFKEGGATRVSPSEADLLSLVHPWAKESTMILAETLREGYGDRITSGYASQEIRGVFK